jgi:hypothetical protein
MKDQLISLLKHEFGADYNDIDMRFTIECAIYWFAHDWYDGDGDPLYEVLCTSKFRPSCLHGGVHSGDDDLAIAMYEYLETFVDNRGIIRLPLLEV